MRRMNAIATAMFFLVLAGAFIAWPFRGSFIGGLLLAACEAALVGALADWFAVVALFRHPLGLKFIPHTAIIPNNRRRITDGIINIVEKDWLSFDFIRSKIFNYPLLDRMAAALETEEGRRGVDRWAQSLVNNALQELKPEDVAKFLQILLKENLDKLKVPAPLVEWLEDSVKNLYTEELINLILDWATSVTRGEEFERAIKRILNRAASDYSNQGNFLRRLSKGLGESLDIIDYDEAAKALAHRINFYLFEMKEPDNQYRLKVITELKKLKIADSEAATAKLSDLLQSVLVSEAGFAATAEVVNLFKTQLINSPNQPQMLRNLTDLAVEQLQLICRDEDRKAQLEFQLKTELVKLLEQYHGIIGKIVREKLESLDDKGLVLSLEEKVGDDLQWIRINGTVIGGLVGTLHYLILRLI